MKIYFGSFLWLGINFNQVRFGLGSYNYIIPNNPAVVPTIIKKQNSAKSLGKLFNTKFI